MQTIFRTYRPGESLWRAYANRADRARALAMLTRSGFNYFLLFVDQGRPALTAGHAKWVKPGQRHVNW